MLPINHDVISSAASIDTTLLAFSASFLASPELACQILSDPSDLSKSDLFIKQKMLAKAALLKGLT